MGLYLNPGNDGFRAIRKQTYVDKSGMISIINNGINTKNNLIAISRPRRFGKSYAAQMLCAYYDSSCDSRRLFDDLNIASDASYNDHLNKYNVIYLDMSGVLSDAKSADDIIPLIKRQITKEIVETFPDVIESEIFSETLINAVTQSKRKFIAIIDEWDVIIRDRTISDDIQKDYFEFLRMLFKNSGTTDKIFAAAYMTGILPIKKDGTQSAITNFKEFTMLRSWKFSEYVGFTEKEVKKLCEDNNMDFRIMKQWYDGYTLSDNDSIYNPNSVMDAITYKKYDSYWQNTSEADSLLQYINMDFDGLSSSVAKLLGGINVEINVSRFKNDIVGIRSKDDVLTMLAHFGYLSYNENSKTVCIPNEEIRMEFIDSVHHISLPETISRVKASQLLIKKVIEYDSEYVAEQIEKIHNEETDPLHYNNEEALRSVIKLAFFCYKDYYVRFDELPCGKGYADVVYLPKKDANVPALLIELKWNKTSDAAISQIKNKNYPSSISDYGGEVILIGINYDEADKKHTCTIEKI
ncbi:MAG: AAA family ATPase [Lachnospiraceae bacterium]|nr:AAA family ATPase [Lachnospiraceae bacterium]